MAVLLAYDDQDNVLWQDFLLLRTVRCEATLTSEVTIETYLGLFCAVTAVIQPNIIFEPEDAPPSSITNDLNDFLTLNG